MVYVLNHAFVALAARIEELGDHFLGDHGRFRRIYDLIDEIAEPVRAET